MRWLTCASRLPADHRLRRGDRRFVLLAGPYPEHLGDVENKDLSVSHLSSAGAPENGIDGGLHEGLGHPDLQAHLLLQVHFHRSASIGLDSLGLAPVAQHAGDGEPPNLAPVQRLQDLVQAVRPDDGDYQLHDRISYWAEAVAGT